jgi:hypothetical protein
MPIIPEDFLPPIGGLLERHVAIVVVTMDQQHQGTPVRLM